MIERPQFNQELYSSIAKIIIDAKTQVYRSSNTILLKMYWEIGKLIIEDEQNGEFRAKYGKSVLKNLAAQISLEFGKGFNERNLNNMRAFHGISNLERSAYRIKLDPLQNYQQS